MASERLALEEWDVPCGWSNLRKGRRRWAGACSCRDLEATIMVCFLCLNSFTVRYWCGSDLRSENIACLQRGSGIGGDKYQSRVTG